MTQAQRPGRGALVGACAGVGGLEIREYRAKPRSGMQATRPGTIYAPHARRWAKPQAQPPNLASNPDWAR